MWKIILAAIAGIILLILFLRVKVVVEAPDDLRLTLYVGLDRKSTRLNSSHVKRSRMPSSA